MLDTFRVFLQDKKTIKPQYVPFYLKWVSDCYRFLNEALSTRLPGDRRKQFLSYKAKRDGHENLQTTMIYTHVASKNVLGVRSPLDS